MKSSRLKAILDAGWLRTGAVIPLLAGLMVVVGSIGPARADPCDGDGDGHAAIECGGDDCDDGDPNRFPGNFEVCDNEQHDEDCDPLTFGARDSDGDRWIDALCCNRDGDGVLRCGGDCDDFNMAIVPGAMRCSSQAHELIDVCLPGGTWEALPCPTGLACGSQPNGTGICSVGHRRRP